MRISQSRLLRLIGTYVPLAYLYSVTSSHPISNVDMYYRRDFDFDHMRVVVEFLGQGISTLRAALPTSI